MPVRWAVCLSLLLLLFIRQSSAFGEAPHPHSNHPSRFWVPLTSFVLPGLGQHIDGRTAWPYYSLGIASISTATLAYSIPLDSNGKNELRAYALKFYLNAGAFSMYDTYIHRVRESYGVSLNQSSVEKVLLAPWHLRHLKNPWVSGMVIASGGIALAMMYSANGMKLLGDEFAPTKSWLKHPFEETLGSPWEEAVFRGFIMSQGEHTLGWSPWAANLLQGILFLHPHPRGGVRPIALVTGFYLGFLTQKFDYSLEEATFAHFWQNTLVAMAMYLGKFKQTDKEPPLQIPLSFRF